MCPKPNIVQGYIEMELALGELERVRKLYERYVTLAPASVAAWLKFAELERSVGETERARAIYDLAIGQLVMDRPEMAWKAAIGARLFVAPPRQPAAPQIERARPSPKAILSAPFYPAPSPPPPPPPPPPSPRRL
jgi:hypothetical protein